MSRVQLALNVVDLQAEIDHYRVLFGVEPNKVRDGYANFIVENPPLKLVLISGMGEAGTLNHLGVELETPELVVEAAERADALGLPTTLQPKTDCCYALQDKVWVHGGEISWEFYTVLEDSPSIQVTEKPQSCNTTTCC